MVEHTITLHSPEPLRGRLPSVPFGKVLAQFGELAALSVRMRLEGISKGRRRGGGRRPDWLGAASDVRYLGHSGDGNGATVLAFEAPRIGEVVPDKLLQQELFAKTPSGNDTPLDLIADAVSAINSAERDSDLFDNHLLTAVARVGNDLVPAFNSAAIAGDRIPRNKPVLADSRTFEQAAALKGSTPRSQMVRVLGVLDMIRFSTSAFALRVEEGDVPCVLLGGEMDKLAELGHREILVQGKAIFRPSGNLLRVEVDHFESGEGQPDVWRRAPQARSCALAKSRTRIQQGPRTGVNAYFGTWPGTESEEEFIREIEGVSG
jgi:hypothetical protein